MSSNSGVDKDRFGNLIDPTVGYARGRILASSVEELVRLVQGQRIATERILKYGKESISVFTGNQRAFPMQAEKMAVVCEEWMGPGLVDESFQQAALNHLGGMPSAHTAALFNRTSGGLVSAVCALAEGKPVVSAVPPGSKSHSSVSRGCYAARVELIECDDADSFRKLLAAHSPNLALITTVSSNLDRVPEDVIRDMVQAGRAVGAVTLIDDAYGARMRPILHGGEHGLKMGADLVITNCDKAGMIGPRAGLLVGLSALVQRVAAKGSEFGMEARAPILAAIEQSLSLFDPSWLKEEAEMGEQLSMLFEQEFGTDIVLRSDLGPVITEDDLQDIVFQRAGKPKASTTLVPAEISSALGMILLRDHGVLTTNTHGQPGAKASLRLRPTPEGVAKLGGLDVVMGALVSSLEKLALEVMDPRAIARLVIGRDI